MINCVPNYLAAELRESRMKNARWGLAIIVFSCAVCWAQSTAQIHGTVQDASGSAVPGAEVKATQTATGVVRTVTTGQDGGYVLTNLPLGPYQLEVTKEGFTKSVQSGIVLQVNSDPAVDVSLRVGAVSEQVSVEANAALVETRNSGIGEVVQTQRIVELPLNGRNVTDLINLGGAAVTYTVTQTRWFNNLPQISIGGQSFFGTDYSLDGASHLNFLSGTTMPVAFPDAVQEFKAESSGQSAQHGAATSVSVVTRSGSNEIHGDLFEFLRNDGFGSAREYFAKGASTYKRNQFGGTLGGPIVKNKLFYFAGFQGTLARLNPGNSTSTVPTAAVLAGDWTTFASPACNAGAQKTLKGGTINNLTNANAVFTGNRIDPSFYIPQSLYIANKVLDTLGPAGITPNQCGVVTYNTPADENDYQGTAKVDYQLSDKQSLFFRVLETEEDIPNSLSLTPVLLAANSNGYNELASSIAMGDTYLISPNMVNAFRMGVNRTAVTSVGNQFFSYCAAGVNIWCGANPDVAGPLSITGGFSFGEGQPDGDHWMSTDYALNDDISWVRGAHQLSFGVGAWQGRVYEFNHFYSVAQPNFNGSVTGLGLADFFLGDLNQLLQGLPNAHTSRQNFVNLYVTDTWKINSRLTFNFGIRWEPFLPQTIGQISNFDMNRFDAGTQSTVFVNAPAGFYFPGDPGFPGESGVYRKWGHFDPRGGIAWDPKGDGKTSIRAAYAFGYAYVPGIQREDASGSNPWGGRTIITRPPGGFSDPYQSFAGGNPFPYVVNQDATFTPRGLFLTEPYDLPTPTTYSWNVAIQRQVGASWILSATYLGSRVQHLYVNVPINYAPIVAGPIVASGCAASATNCNSSANIDARRLLSLANPSQGQYIGAMDQWDPVGNQNYNGLLLSAQRRLSRGVSMSANWTWSHCIGLFQGTRSKADVTVTAPNNPYFDTGNCDSDRRNVANVTAVAQVPQFSNRALRLAATGWQMAGIYRFSSGMPISIQDGTDRELSGLGHQRPNVVLPDAVYTGHTGPGAQYLNPAAFALQPLGTTGNLGWNSLVGPTYWDLDLALSRQFHIRERQLVELRADAFNVTNSFVSNPPPTVDPTNANVPAFENLSSNQFGQIIAGGVYGAQPTRKIQFALKYVF
jgi:Carboxypeptidase regulatory-like domain